MDNLLLMDILQPEEELDEPLDDLLLSQRFVVIAPLLQILFKIALLSILHHDADWPLLDEGLMVANDVAVIELLHKFDLLEYLLLGLLGAVLEFDFLG